MIGTVFRTEDVPVEDRFATWRDLVGRTRSSEIVSAHQDDFWATYRVLPLGPVTVWPTSFLPTHHRRSPRLVRQSDPELFHLTLLLDGRLHVEHAGRAGSFGPGRLLLADSSLPYDVRSAVAAPGRVVQGVGVDFPKAMLPLPPRRVRELLARGLSGRDGQGALVADLLTGLDRHADALDPADPARLGRVVLDLVSAWLAGEAEADAALPAETCQRALVHRVQAFIRQNLHDPELTPPVVAAAHHISLSYLHRIFPQHARGRTVAAWIRAQRLDAARRDLADPSLHALPVHAVAARWGFTRASDFTRAFRHAHGLSPTECRDRALLPHP
ncbi:helix-turn-helix domain-containing protein [Kitasatospora sp. NPDC051914]|uniref:AraC-like ligand-binding domain-containing protein n=1 Tax=Kitasatospora sp. NPDC051914 TaxID=3154945 RepID=UPI003432EF36